MNSDTSRLLERMIIVSLPGDRPPTEQEIAERAAQLRAAFPLTEEEFSALLKRLHARLAIEMDMGVFLAADHRPWLNARKPEIDPFYWGRFRQLLEKKDWPPKVIATLDRVTDDLLDLVGNPAEAAPWGRRGLVVGDVQSGKTATYTALCCKAGDAGYRLIILLTGTLESLRRQTQERMDEGFVGLDSSGVLTKIRTSRAVGVGLIDSRKSAGVFTSREKDFNKILLNSLGFRLDIFKEPVLVVVKKNKRMLENLETWLREFNAHNGRIEAPVLIVDDEADSASVNTRPADEDPTTINKLIRSLLRLFTHSSYIGFTATPFANVFIDPETEDAMVGSDLFPKDFIYSLEPPTNYVGPQAIFGDDPRLDPLRPIEDADGVFPARHKSNFIVPILPQSLTEAVQSYLLATTIRDLRGEGTTHRSMLVNVSRFTSVQDQVASLIHTWLSQAQQDIRNYSQLSSEEALRNSTLSALHHTWSAEFSGLGIPWERIQANLVTATLPVVVQAVNQRTGAASLDYSKHRESGLRVIAVGGNSLSRGLTLEGLSTSYFFRNSQMYDTLLQMGRWFGYRDRYEDLCRVWLTNDAIDWYSHITMASDELRAEVKKMRIQGRTPKEFGLKVRAHPDSLIVTAQNKMRNAKTVDRIISISGQLLETPRLKTNENIVRANKQVVDVFLRSLRDTGFPQTESGHRNPFWRAIPKAFVVKLLRNFDIHPLNISFQPGDLAHFIENTSEDRLQEWDVVLPQGTGTPTELGDVKVNRNKRDVRIDDNSVLVSGHRARVASRGIEREGLSSAVINEITTAYKKENKNKSVPNRAYREARSRPLLIVHAIQPEAIGAHDLSPDLIALGLSFPVFDDSDVAKRVRYRVNLVEWKTIAETEADDDLDEADTDDTR